MVYYALLDISQLSDINTDLIREGIKQHFAQAGTLKRKESVAAKALLCMILKGKFNLTDFTVECDKNGKPFIVGSEICFNLSHSGSNVLCVLGKEQVGCDIQEIKEYNPKVTKRFFTQNEHAYLESCEKKELDFTRLWALKESALKFSGDGMSGGLDRYDFSEYYNKDSFTLEDICFNSFEFGNCVVCICSETGCISQLEADIDDIINYVY